MNQTLTKYQAVKIAAITDRLSHTANNQLLVTFNQKTC
jgi:hypothetical protein